MANQYYLHINSGVEYLIGPFSSPAGALEFWEERFEAEAFIGVYKRNSVGMTYCNVRKITDPTTFA